MSAEIQLKLGFVINFVYACFTVYEKIFTVDTNHEKSINEILHEIDWKTKKIRIFAQNNGQTNRQTHKLFCFVCFV